MMGGWGWAALSRRSGVGITSRGGDRGSDARPASALRTKDAAPRTPPPKPGHRARGDPWCGRPLVRASSHRARDTANRAEVGTALSPRLEAAPRCSPLGSGHPTRPRSQARPPPGGTELTR